MESNSQDEEVLYTLASECESLFVDLHKALGKSDSATSVHELCTEFQQRFAAWTAHLGVFARKSQCLDTRLRNFPDLQDLTVRLLDILRRCLYQWKSATDRPLEEQFDHVQFTLEGIDDTLSRLNNLGVTIRQSSADKIDSKAMRMATGSDSDRFEHLCMQAIHVLYSGTPQALKDRLIQSMIKRRGRIMHFGKRHEQLSTRRDPRPSLSTIPEARPIALQAAPEIAPPLTTPLASHPKTPHAPSVQSDLSSVNIQQIMRRSRAPDELSTRFAKTLSVQVKQGNYPKPPGSEAGGTYFTCQWCSESINRRTLTESAWQRHIERDLTPYVCLSEDCTESHKSYPNFFQWFEHMQQHGRRWHQKSYLKPSWVCTVCQSGYQAYNTPQALHSHLQESHSDDFTEGQLQTISGQSKTEKQRAWTDCLLCSLTADVESNTEYETGDKRRKVQSGNEAIKSARTSLETRSAGPQGQHSEDSDTTLDSDSDSGTHEPGCSNDHSKSVAKHIAGHLQMLMLLTLRLAALMNDTGIDEDDVNNNSVEVDGGDSIVGGSVEKGSFSDIDVEMGNQELADEAHDPDDDVRNDDTIIPDCDMEVIIPTQYDYLHPEDDEFLQGVIRSGAYQSWRNGTLEKALRASAVVHKEPYPAQHFWGYASLKKIITRERVVQELLTEEGRQFNPQEAEKLGQIILPPTLPTQHHRRREVPGYQPAYLAIFALLILTGRMQDVVDFLIPDFSDGRLLFADRVILDQCAEKCGWNYMQRDTFDRLWRGFLVPYFDTGINGIIEVSPHLDLPEHALLPWLMGGHPYGADGFSWGAFGSATKEKIDSNSHNFNQLLNPVGLDCEYVTVKRISLKHDADQRIFHAEVDMLKRFGAGARQTSANPQDRTYRHVMSLLGTYNIGDNFFFVFPGVECTLEEYLTTTPALLDTSLPRPRARLGPSNAAIMLWLSEQIMGLMAAVNLLHSESGLSPEGLPAAPKNARYGDLNLENIHWLKCRTDMRGIFVIGDLGVADVYGGHRYSSAPDEKLNATSIYCAPEYKIMNAGISQAYDIWTLGCIFLEIITWALGGNEARARFIKKRSEADPSWFETRFFFDTKKRGAKYVFIVKEEVTEHMAYLHTMSGCTQYIHDLLDLIGGSMLRIRPNDRATAEELLRTLKESHSRGCAELAYVASPTPAPGNLGSHEREEWIADHLVPGLMGIRRIGRLA